MAEIEQMNKSKGPILKKDFRKKTIEGIYQKSLITRNIVLKMNAIGQNLTEIIESHVSVKFSGKCIVEGFVEPNSISIVSYSSGLISGGDNVLFEVIFQCNICYPVEGMILNCVVRNITKAGIRGESADNISSPSPFIIFIAKDHHVMNEAFSKITQEGQLFNARVIGQRFELNDKYISIIGELVKSR